MRKNTSFISTLLFLFLLFLLSLPPSLHSHAHVHTPIFFKKTHTHTHTRTHTNCTIAFTQTWLRNVTCPRNSQTLLSQIKCLRTKTKHTYTHTHTHTHIQKSQHTTESCYSIEGFSILQSESKIPQKSRGSTISTCPCFGRSFFVVNPNRKSVNH